MRAKIYPIIETKGKTLEDKNALKEQVRGIILATFIGGFKIKKSKRIWTFSVSF